MRLAILILFILLSKWIVSQNIESKDEIYLLKQHLQQSRTSIDKAFILSELSLKYGEINLDSSIYYARKNLVLAKQLNNSELLADSYYTLGVSFKNYGQLDSAGICLFVALDLYKDSNKKIITSIAIGEFYRANAELEKARIFLTRAINDSKTTNNEKNLPHAFNRLGATYFELSINNEVIDGVFEDSLYKTINIVDSSIFWSNKFKIDEYIVSNYNILGACYQHLRNYSKAISYLNLALNAAIESNKLIEVPMIYRNISLNYMKINEFDVAKEMALKGVIMSDSLKLSSSLYFNYYTLALIGYASQDYKLALNYLAKADSVKNIINAENSKAEFKKLETRYKTKEKELLIDQQNIKLDRIKKQFNYIIFSSVLVFFIILGGIFFILRIRKINRLMELKNVEIEKSSQELKKVSQFKNDLMGMIAHDLKNPLNTILNFSKMGTRDNAIDITKLKNNSANIESAALNMLNIVNNIIDLQNFEQAKLNLSKTENYIRQLINNSVENVTLLCSQKNISINNTVSNNIAIKCDKELIERVLVNLLTNAIKFTPVNETILIQHEIVDGFVKINITDKGPGIPQDKIPLLFNKYSRVEIRNSGFSNSSGLGLAFSKLVINAHAGKVGVESELGNGSCFWFSLKVSKIQEQTLINRQELTETQLNYSNEFLQEIAPLQKKLEEFHFYETSEILNTINNFSCKHSEYGYWKGQIENAILYSNKDKYIELIKIK